jgi:hypothetical protein
MKFMSAEEIQYLVVSQNFINIYKHIIILQVQTVKLMTTVRLHGEHLRLSLIHLEIVITVSFYIIVLYICFV